MPPVLPIELHEEIIECLLWYRPMYYATLEAEPELEFTSSKETLAACALTCKAWLYICRKHLYRLIRISDPRRFDALTRELPVLSQLISKVTEFVHITDDTDTSPFSHLAPHYLSTRAPHVKDLFLGSERFDSPHFRFHSTSIMLLAQFRNVRTLRMSNFFFTSSTELRRVIGSFTNLFSTTLSGLTWDNQVAYPPQLLRTTCWRLSQVRMYDCSSNHDGFWFWIVPPLRAPSNNFVGFGGENSHFGLTLHDAYALSDLFRACLSVNGKPNGNPGAFFDWEYLTKQNTWVLKCRARLNNSSFQMRIMLQPRTVNNYTKLPISNQAVEGTVCHLHLTYNSDQKQSLDYWKQIDIKISTFVELEGVELAWVTPSSPFTPKGHQGEENENKTYGRDIAKYLILTRELCQIKVMVDSTSITEEDIRSQESLVQTQLVVDDKLD